MFKNMLGMGNASDQPSQHKLDNLKNIMINKGIAIVGLAEVNSNWSKFPLKIIHILGRKSRSITTGDKRVTTYDVTFQIGGTSIMAIDEISCREIETGKEFRNLGRWSWMLLQGKKNVITKIITRYFHTLSASAGVLCSQKLQPLTSMKIQNYPGTQFL